MRTILAFVVVLVACGGDDAEPRAQWTVTLATDAPLPQFGDRVLIELLDEQGRVCRGCQRLAAPEPGDWPLSFGVVPDEGDEDDTHRLRVRLFRSARTAVGGLPSGPHIDVVGILPELDGVTEAEMILGMDCFGVPASPPDRLSCSRATGELAPEAPLAPASETIPEMGSWPPAQPIDCPGPVPDDMVCIPGGVFLLGGAPDLPHTAGTSPLPERLVQLSPFAIDIDEMTVGTFEKLNIAVAGDVPEPCALAPSGDPDRDARSVDCAPYILAHVACRESDKQMVSEAQWEYAAGQTQLETTYPWGESTDLCEMAALGLGPLPGESPLQFTDFSCRLDDNTLRPFGPVAGGDPDDVTNLGVRNMGGNLSEWVADRFAPYDDPCWNTGDNLLVDPRCDGALSAEYLAYKGGSYLEQKVLARVYHRWVFDYPAFAALCAQPAPNCTVPQIGIRCALNYDP